MRIQYESYYFGCCDRPGHHLWHPNGHTASRFAEETIPWPDTALDMTLCPGVIKVSYGHKADRQVEGESKIHHKDGWTALAFWDRSVDTRGNCNSVFVIHGTHDFEAMVKLAREVFPKIWERFKFEVVEA